MKLAFPSAQSLCSPAFFRVPRLQIRAEMNLAWLETGDARTRIDGIMNELRNAQASHFCINGYFYSSEFSSKTGKAEDR